jgi:sulfatase maturation enzyme AslB (radical SAM superfamily)
MKQIKSLIRSIKFVRKLVWLIRIQHKLPNTIEIEFDSRCNRKCIYCPNSFFDRPHETLSFDTYKEIVRQLTDLKWRGFFSPHFYNEPMLDDRLESILLYAKEKLKTNIYIKLYTNGDLLTTDLIKKWMLHDKITDEMVITMHGESIKNKEDIITLSKSPEFKNRIKILTPEGIKKAYSNRGGILNINSKNVSSAYKKYGCHHSQRMVISAKGNNVLCCNDYFEKTVFGNIHDTTIRELWNRSKPIRKEIYIGTFRLPICKACVS